MLPKRLVYCWDSMVAMGVVAPELGSNEDQVWLSSVNCSRGSMASMIASLNAFKDKIEIETEQLI